VQLAQTASVAIENTLYADAREANRLKDEFLATLSHELRTPLNAMLGWTRLLRMEQLTPQESSHGLEVIERNVRAQAKLIEDLLDVSRITAGKLRLHARHTELEPILQAAVESARPNAQARGVSLSLQVEPAAAGGLITCDPDRLQQVFWNLLSNALKFTLAGGKISVVCTQREGYYRISFTDTGRGISPDFLPYVFDRFRQGDASTIRSHGGLGIGLTIVRHIVELHGGSVHAESAGEGRGATFMVALPVAAPIEGLPAVAAPEPEKQTPAPAETPAVVPAQAPTHRVNLGGLRVLVVDDEPDARELIAEVLRRHGARVRSAGDVDSALAALDEETFDLLLSDIAMPHRDGYDLLQTLRTRPGDRGGRLPAIALTAYARDEDRLRAQRAGFQLHLSKPVDPVELIGSVQRLTLDSERPDGNGSAMALTAKA
jgi:CheY-like chemotaxis protein